MLISLLPKKSNKGWSQKKKFKILVMDPYDGKKDPTNYLDMFQV